MGGLRPSLEADIQGNLSWGARVMGVRGRNDSPSRKCPTCSRLLAGLGSSDVLLTQPGWLGLWLAVPEGHSWPRPPLSPKRCSHLPCGFSLHPWGGTDTFRRTGWGFPAAGSGLPAEPTSLSGVAGSSYQQGGAQPRRRLRKIRDTASCMYLGAQNPPSEN